MPFVPDTFGDDVIGCIYLYPAKQVGHDVRIRSWVRSDRADWPFEAPDYDAR
jgi:hypothetical protein